MLEIKNIKSGYAGAEILHGVDIEVKEGETVVIIGPNGSGKSTVLKSIFGLADIYNGKVVFNDEDITKLKTHQLIAKGISFVPQGRLVFSDMTVMENLEMGAFIIKDKIKVKKAIEGVFKKYPILKDKKDENASSLSGGQQQLLAIARALVQSPKLLLLDEPSLGLSPKVMKEVFERILEINKQGIAVLMVEQNAKQAVEIADRTYILEAGNIALTGGKEILKNPKVKEIYFG